MWACEYVYEWVNRWPCSGLPLPQCSASHVHTHGSKHPHACAGRAELEARCQQLCLDILTLVQASPDSQLMRWAATTPAGSWLCSCRFPGLRAAMAQRLTEPEACLEAWPASLAALHSAGLEAATGWVAGLLLI